MILFLFHTRLLHNLIKILLFQVWVNAPLNLEAFSDFLSSQTYYTVVTIYWYLVKIVETHLEIIKDGGIVFGQFPRLSVVFTWLPFLILDKKKETNFFWILMYQKHKIKSKIAFNRQMVDRKRS